MSTKQHAHNMWRKIITNDRQNIFDLDKSFFELDMVDIAILGTYAQILHIRPKNGKSPARHLWDSIKE